MGASKFAGEMQAIQAVLDALEPLDETQRRFVLRTAERRLDITTRDHDKDTRKDDDRNVSRERDSPESDSPANFLAAKNPETDIERITVLAYMLKERGTTAFKTRDLTKMNTDAAGADFSNASFAVRNATNARLLAKAGGGRKQITPRGEAVVKALPDPSAVKAVLENFKTRRNRKAKRKKRRPRSA